nr:gibberellin 2-beta-dioxygenase 2-like [Tanacetum cinerariifolium]
MVVATQKNPIRIEKTGEMTIPSIDLTGNESKVSKLIVKACEEYGFFKVVNHGIDDHIIKTMENESFEFFNKPLLEKQRAELAKPFGYGNKNIGLSGDTGELEYLLLQANQDFIDNTSMLISNDPSSFRKSFDIMHKEYNNGRNLSFIIVYSKCKSFDDLLDMLIDEERLRPSRKRHDTPPPYFGSTFEPIFKNDNGHSQGSVAFSNEGERSADLEDTHKISFGGDESYVHHCLIKVLKMCKMLEGLPKLLFI